MSSGKEWGRAPDGRVEVITVPVTLTNVGAAECLGGKLDGLDGVTLHFMSESGMIAPLMLDVPTARSLRDTLISMELGSRDGGGLKYDDECDQE